MLRISHGWYLIALYLRCVGVFTSAKFLQMSLCERFAEASSSRAVNISSLEKEKPYTLAEAER
jgi:hypothetical protein